VLVFLMFPFFGFHGSASLTLFEINSEPNLEVVPLHESQR
jgi:hypothetical protein